jgi:cytochrome P450
MQLSDRRSIAELPGPRRLPGLGNAHQLRPLRLHAIGESWAARYGPLFRFDIGARPIIGVARADLITEVLRDRPWGHRRWRNIADVLAEIGVVGVFSAEGEDWRRQRGLAVRALNSQHLARYFSVVSTVAARLHRRWRRRAEADAVFDIHRELMSFTVDVTSWLAFGKDRNTLENTEDELQAHIERVFRMIARRDRR